nr:MAG TPA: hypothetical protein [Caudoviricetes sp.]DAR22081.1 MAG TPA: hypothetical protein [Caudoviricetes sp.]
MAKRWCAKSLQLFPPKGTVDRYEGKKQCAK